MNIVPTNVLYNSYLLRQNLILLNHAYPFLNIQVVGNSVLGKPIYVVKLGNGPHKVFYSGSIHANEWITSILLMKFIENYCDAYVSNGSLYGYPIRQLFNSTSIYIMPMVNPDGVDLVNGYINQNSTAYQNVVAISNRFPDIPFPSGWKANINGVDFSNFQYTLLINRLDWRLLCWIILFSKFLHIQFFHYLLIYYHLLYLND